jgi:hypothetical protein
MFAPSNPDHPDIQAILSSMALDPTAEVQYPTHQPADPPEGMAAPCMGQNLPTEGTTDSDPLTGIMEECAQVTDADPLMWVICNVQDSFRSRNTQPLLGYMGDPFHIGYWQSEGVDRTPEQALFELEEHQIPADPSGLTFTMDRALFPSLFGMQPEQIFPPDANIVGVVYSEGWEQDGQSAVLLYFADNGIGDIYFYGMLVGIQ